MNLLIHQDYGDHSRKAVIEFFTDGIKFWNPGDAFADEKQARRTSATPPSRWPSGASACASRPAPAFG